MTEQWRQIDDTRYEISDKGRVRNSIKGNILKGSKHNHGYRSVCLRIDNKDSYKLIHRLIASAFIPNNDSKKDCINHIDGDKLNNSISNLEWCTKAENNKHACQAGLRKGGNSIQITEAQVLEARKLYDEGLRVSQISKKFQLDWNVIDNIIKRKTYKNI